MSHKRQRTARFQPGSDPLEAEPAPERPSPKEKPSRPAKGGAAGEQGAAKARPTVAKSAGSARKAAKAAKNPGASGPRQTGMGLHTADGLRKYLTAGERDGFLREAERAGRAVWTLCMTLAYAGCRLSEALALTADRADQCSRMCLCSAHQGWLLPGFSPACLVRA
jgi:integrase